MRLIKHVALSHGWGEAVEGNLIAKSSVRMVRHNGVENHPAGRNVIAAQPTKRRKTEFAASPSENRGGCRSRIRPRRATTMPSHHFCVPPPRKQASTGKI